MTTQQIERTEAALLDVVERISKEATTAENGQGLRRLKRTVLLLSICNLIQSIVLCQLVLFGFKVCRIIELLSQQINLVT